MKIWLSKNNQHAIFMKGRRAFAFPVSDPDAKEKYNASLGTAIGHTVGKWVQSKIEKFDALPVIFNGEPVDSETNSLEVVDFGVKHTITLMHPVPGKILTFQAIVNGKSAVVQFYVRRPRRGKTWLEKINMRVRLVNEDGLPSFLILEH